MTTYDVYEVGSGSRLGIFVDPVLVPCDKGAPNVMYLTNAAGKRIPFVADDTIKSQLKPRIWSRPDHRALVLALPGFRAHTAPRNRLPRKRKKLLKAPAELQS